jgi:hypothetical protein
MSQDFDEGRLKFRFPNGWLVCRPESTSFYTRHFQNFCGGCREMDFLAFDPATHVLWLIEVKDYENDRRTKQQDLADEVAVKARDILAMLPVALVRDQGISSAGNLQVREFWRHARNAKEMRVVLHCELPVSPSKLFPSIRDAANLQTKLTQKLRCVDPHARFTNSSMAHTWQWTVN